MKHTSPGFQRVLVLTAALVALSVAAMANSSLVAYQGLLRATDGTVVADGPYDMGLSIWDAPVGGNQLWSESYAGVAVLEGRFSVFMGAMTPLGSLFADHSDLWLEMAADTGTGTEIYSPRVPLTSVGYAQEAIKATTADTADNATHATTATTAANVTTATTATNATNVTTATTATNATNVTNATNAVNADTVDTQHAAAFAPAGHTHGAAAITSGTIPPAVYSSWADLLAEGRAGAAATQVALGAHRHPGLPYWVGQVGGQLSGTKALFTQEAQSITTTPSGGGTALIAPVAGRYFVHFQQLTNTSPGATYLSMRHNGNVVGYGWISGGQQEDMIVSAVVNMNANDTITFTIDTVVQGYAWGGEHSSVSMFLIGQP